jgi:membrane protease YdiL (CAAX protease family)
MQQRYGRAIRVTAITLCAAVALSDLQLPFLYMAPLMALVWQVGLTAAVATLWVRWQRAEWRRALPRRASAWRVVTLAVVICLAVTSVHQSAIAPTIATNIQHAGDALGTRAAAVLTAVATGPLLDEALFRGYLLGRLRRILGSTTSVLLSGVTFAVAHSDATRILPRLVAAIVLGTIVVYTGRLWLAVLAHGLANAIGMIEYVVFTAGIPARLGIGFPLLCLVIAVGAALELHRVLTTTRWSVPVPPTARVALPLTWGLDAKR